MMHPLDKVKSASFQLAMIELAGPNANHDADLEYGKDQLIIACRELIVHVDTKGKPL